MQRKHRFSYYVPLHIRLTLFYALALGLALWFFSSIVYQQAATRAYQDLDTTLKNRAASVTLSKIMLSTEGDTTLASNPYTLPGIDALGGDGVAIELLDSQLRLLASTSPSTTNSSLSLKQPGIQNLGSSPVPWDRQAAQQLLQAYNQHTHSYTDSNAPPGQFSTGNYQGQHIRIYTLLSTAFGTAHIIQAARAETAIEQSLANLRWLLLGGGALVLLLALSGGWLLSWSVLSAVQRMTRAAGAISAARDFNQRVPSRSSFLLHDELATLADTFNQMLTSLQEAYQHQQRFVADASHELRAPITSLRCNLDLLATAPDLPRAEAQAALSDARSEAERMARLINDLLWLARADEAQHTSPQSTLLLHTTSGSLDYKNTDKLKIDLDSLFLDIFRQYQRGDIHMQDEGSIPHMTLQHIIPVKVYGDADQLKQAIVALLDNALKYTPQAGHISLALHSTDEYALVTIQDSGIGIAPEDLPHIFERFYRARHARAQDRSGSGLGLPIAQNIAQMHGGTIEVVSTPGTGSTFTLKLPLAKEQA